MKRYTAILLALLLLTMTLPGCGQATPTETNCTERRLRCKCATVKSLIVTPLGIALDAKGYAITVISMPVT